MGLQNEEGLFFVGGGGGVLLFLLLWRYFYRCNCIIINIFIISGVFCYIYSLSF